MGAGVLFVLLVIGGGILLAGACFSERGEVVRRVLDASDEAQDEPPSEAAILRRRRITAWLIGANAFVILRALLGLSSGFGEAPYAILGALTGEMFLRVRREAADKKLLRQIDFHLPNAMERVVMAVGAGLDVVPALREATRDCIDPVSAAFREVVALSEAGAPAVEAMQSVSERTKSFSLRHALVHLGIAHAQGGEIVKPLKELSDATQAAFQESVDEQIARLPVKAVLPLVVTFAGLILCFVTVPLLQIGSITRRVADAAQP
jgi:Flp pilus assembly protein TadB